MQTKYPDVIIKPEIIITPCKSPQNKREVKFEDAVKPKIVTKRHSSLKRRPGSAMKKIVINCPE